MRSVARVMLLVAGACALPACERAEDPAGSAAKAGGVGTQDLAAAEGARAPEGTAAAVDPPVERPPERIRSSVIGRSGARIGEVLVRPRPQGVVFDLRVEGLEPGAHAVHVHHRGACEAPDFRSAGGHYDPAGARHGRPDGDPDLDDPAHHAGDMPNHTVDGSGVLEAEIRNRTVTLGGENALLDGDGSALVVHAGADDYTSQPSGAAGRRVACAELGPRRDSSGSAG